MQQPTIPSNQLTSSACIHTCAGTPRVGANAAISTNAEGADQAQRRTAATELQTLPLRSTGQSSGGAAAIDPDRTETTLNARSAAVAKGIVDDNGNFGRSNGFADGSVKILRN
jgi:hypothetical protein